MISVQLPLFVSGAIFLGYLVAAFFFTRFWRETRDLLFGCFALAFYLLALERVLLLSTSSELNSTPEIYLVRLTAFLVIIWGIWDKNRPSAK